jgi:hypothetical protein
MPPSDALDHGRRRFLKTGGATLTVGLTTALAGCQSGIPPLSGQLNFGRIDAPQPTADGYTRWVPAAAASPTSDDADEDDGVDHVWHAQPARLTESPFGAASLPVGITTGRLDHFGVGYRTYERAVTALSSSVTIAVGGFDRTTVADAVAGTGYEERGGYRGWATYGRDDLPRSVAVDDSVLVYAQSGTDEPDTARRRVETTIDAGEGRVPRQTEAEPAFATLVERAASRPGNWLGVSPFGGVAGSDGPELDSLATSSISWDFDDEAVYFVYDLVFPEGTQAPERAIKDSLRGQRRAVESSLIDIETDGRFARVELRRPARTVDSSGRGDGHPQITWGVEYDRTSQQVTVRHEAGETADAARLSIGNVAPEATPFAKFDRFEPGDSVTVQVEDSGGLPLRVVYTSPDGDSSMTLFSYDPAEEDA